MNLPDTGRVSPDNDQESMTAIGFYEHGDIDNLELLSVEKPVPEPDEVLVEVKAAALNHQDLLAVRELEQYVPEYPFWGGGDFAGVIAAVGKDIEDWSRSDRVVVNPALSCGECEFCIQGEHSQCVEYEVYGEHRKGGFAEYVTVPRENLLKVPDGYNLVKAAAAPMAAGTAWRMLATRADVKPYEDLLIVGATGGVGSYAVQIATNVFDVDTLYATTSTKKKAAFLRDLGADHIINYTEERFDARIWELTDERGVDVIVNTVGGETWTRSMRSLRNGGRLVTPGATAGPTPETEIRLIFVRQLSILGSTTHSQHSFKQVMKYIWDGTIEPVVQATYPFHEFKKAFTKMANRELYGKIVLTPE